METESLASDYHSTEQPHFDEEWTLLTARPVVPLEEVKSARTRRRGIRIIGLFVAALLLGGISALVVVSLERSHNIPGIQNETIANQSEEVPVDVKPESAITPETPSAADPGDSVRTEATNAPKAVAVVREKTKAAERDKGQKPEPSETNKESIEADLDSTQKPRAVLFDELGARWEERRARRVRRQERRERGGRRGRDLLRIDEIFEGPRP